MPDLSNILAAKEDDALMKVVFFAAVALIWGIGALVKMASKKKDQEHRERVRRELEESRKNAPDYNVVVNQPPVKVPTPPQRQSAPAPVYRAPPAPPRKPPPVPQQQRQPKQKKQKKAPKPPIVVAQQVEEATTQRVFAAQSPVRSKQATANVDADQLRNWLRPQTLREQFILTEILQPPLALRRREE